MPKTSVPAQATAALQPSSDHDSTEAPGSEGGAAGKRPTSRLAIAGTSLAVVAIAALGVRAAGMSVWMDEAYSLDSAHRGLRDVMHHAFTFEFQPPLYFVALHAWLRIHDSPAFARLLSILCVCIAIVLAHLVGRRLGIRRWYANPALVLAGMPFTQWASTEIRTSPFTMACAAASMLAFTRLTTDEHPKHFRDAALLAATWLVGLFTFYYLGFLLAGQTVAGWLDRRLRRPLLAVIGVATVGILPLAGMILAQKAGQEQMGSTDAFHGAVRSIGAMAAWAGGFLFDSFVGVPTADAAPAYHAATLVAALTFVTAAAVGSGRASDHRHTGAMLLLVTAVPVAACLLFGLTGIAPTATRYCGAVAIVPLAVLIGYAIDRAASAHLGQLMAALTFVVLLYSSVSLQRNRLPAEDWKAVAAQLRAERTNPTEPVFVFEADAVLPLRQYYDSASVHALPREPDLEGYSTRSRRIESVGQVEEIVSRAVAPGQPFWLILRGAQVTATGELGESTLREWMSVHTREASVRPYHRIRVYHLFRTGPTPGGAQPPRSR